MNDERKIADLIKRIEQLGNKSTQVLIFLSFAFLATVTLKSGPTIAPSQQRALIHAMQCWAIALPFVLLQVLPVRDIVDRAKSWNKARYYEWIRWGKVIFLFAAVLLIIIGAVYFAYAIGEYAVPVS